MNDRIDDDLLDRYLAAEISPDERAVVDAWLAARPERGAMLEAMRASLRGPMSGFDTEAAWSALQHRLDDRNGRDEPIRTGGADGSGESPRPRRFAARPSLSSGWKAAALIAGLLLGGALLSRIVVERPTGNALQSRRIVTLAGQRDTVSLPDGSTVILAPASTLEIEADFNDGTRDVRLEGQAFFSVVHDPGSPFRIAAAQSRVVVLGTRFGVYSRSAGVVVAVEEGRVEFGPAGEPDSAVLLTAGRVGRLVAGKGRPITNGGSAAALAWLDDVLEFDDAPLRDVVAEIERWFDVRLRIDDEATADRRVAGRFNAASADAVLDALSLALGLTLERTDSVIVIRAAGVR